MWQLDFIQSSSLPRLAWCAVIGESDHKVVIHHGPWIEVGEFSSSWKARGADRTAKWTFPAQLRLQDRVGFSRLMACFLRRLQVALSLFMHCEIKTGFTARIPCALFCRAVPMTLMMTIVTTT